MAFPNKPSPLAARCSAYSRAQIVRSLIFFQIICSIIIYVYKVIALFEEDFLSSVSVLFTLLLNNFFFLPKKMCIQKHLGLAYFHSLWILFNLLFSSTFLSQLIGFFFVHDCNGFIFFCCLHVTVTTLAFIILYTYRQKVLHMISCQRCLSKFSF